MLAHFWPPAVDLDPVFVTVGIAAAGCSSSMHSDRLRVALNCIGEMACGYLLATGLLSASHVFLLDIISPCRASLN